MPRIEHGEQIGDAVNGYFVVELLSIDEMGNSAVVGYAVLGPDGNEVWRGDDLDEAFGQRDKFAGPKPRGPSGPGM